MSYLIERQQVFKDEEVIAILAVGSRGANSHVLLRDGSTGRTASHPKTLRRVLQAHDRHEGLIWINDRRKPQK